MGQPANWSLFGWDANDWAAFGQTLFSWQPQKDAWNKGYYGCLAQKNIPFVTIPPTVHLLAHAASESAEEAATSGAGAYYHFADGRFTAWGKYSKVLVPDAAASIAPYLKAAGPASIVLSEGEFAASIAECSEVLK